MGKKGKARRQRAHRWRDADAALTISDRRGPKGPPGDAEPEAAAGSRAQLVGSQRTWDLDATDLAASLVSVGAQLQRQVGHGPAEDGLTRARLSALGRLVLGGPCTLGELAAHEGVRPPTMTRLVHSMEAAGLVERQRHPTDGRMILVRATAGGQAVLAGGRAARLGPLASAIAALQRDERRELARASTVLGRFLRGVGRTRRPA